MATLNARDLFEHLGSEQTGGNRKPEVTTGVMKGLLEGFEGYLSDAHLLYVQGMTHKRYPPHDLIWEITSELGPIRSKDIEQLSRLMTAYCEHPNFADEAGRYLTGCVNNCIEEDITIDTRRWRSNTRDISMSTDKHVTIRGNAGDFAGSFMRKGTLVIEGSVGACMGYQMTGGKIILNGVAYRREAK